MAACTVVYATGIMLLATLALGEATGRPTMEPTFGKPGARRAAAVSCSPSNINIQQAQTSGVGIPKFTVHITNLCTNSLCTISNVIVNCGQFHSATYVNPNVFKRYGAGTCIVNNGGVIPNAGIVTFTYSEIWKQNLSFQSAKVTCR